MRTLCLALAVGVVGLLLPACEGLFQQANKSDEAASQLPAGGAFQTDNCLGGALCDDNNPCTLDLCDPNTGCRHVDAGDVIDEFAGFVDEPGLGSANGRNGLHQPFDFDWGPDGDIFVSSANFDIHGAAPDGAVFRLDGTTGAYKNTVVRDGMGGLDGPTALVIDATDRMYVNHNPTGGLSEDFVVRVYDVDVPGLAVLLDTFVLRDGAGDPVRSTGLLLHDGMLWAVDFRSGVYRYNPNNGSYIDTFAPPRPSSLVGGRSYMVADSTNNILYVSLSEATRSGAPDDQIYRYGLTTGADLSPLPLPAGLARWNSPYGMVFGPDGTLLVGSGGTGDSLARVVVGADIGDPTELSERFDPGATRIMQMKIGPDGYLYVTGEFHAQVDAGLLPRGAMWRLALGETCTDGNSCTATDVCNTLGQCEGLGELNLVACDDGDLCTTGDMCNAGSCEGTMVTCGPTTGTNPCMTNECDPARGSCGLAVADDTPCSILGNLCVVSASCQQGMCEPELVDCGDDGDRCTDNDCDPNSGQCFTPVDASSWCDDDNECTAESCDPLLGCQSTPAGDGNSCDDGNLCTSAGQCSGGSCAPGVAVQCPDSDGDPCTMPTCVTETGACTEVEIPGCAAADCPSVRADVTGALRTPLFWDSLSQGPLAGKTPYDLDFDSSGAVYVAASDGLYKSTNPSAADEGDVTWSLVGISGLVGGLTVVHVAPTHIYTAADSSPAGGNPTSIHVLDATDTHVRTRPIVEGATGFVSSMASSTEVVLVGGRAGRIYRTTNHGDSWSMVGDSGGAHVSQMVRSATVGGVLVAGCGANDTYLETTNEGASFTLGGAAPAQNFWAAGLHTWGINAPLLVAAASNGNQFDAVYQCDIPCRTWSAVGNSALIGGQITASSAPNVWRAPLSVSTTGPARMAVASQTELWVSSDHGTTWRLVSNLWSCGTAGSIHDVQFNGDFLYVSTSAGVFRTAVAGF